MSALAATGRKAVTAGAAATLLWSRREARAEGRFPRAASIVHTTNANNPSEDRAVSGPPTQSTTPHVAAVFDGHGGWQMAEFARKRMPSTVNRALAARDANAAALGTAPDTPRALVGAFESVERQWLGVAVPAVEAGFGRPAGHVGACALVAVVDDASIAVANAGDCRAVLVRHTAGTGGGDADAPLTGGALAALSAGVSAEALTNDHNAREALQQAWLRSQHPGEDDVVYCKRPTSCYTKRRLQPCRTLGDLYLKYPEFNGTVDGNNVNGRRIGYPYTPPYVTATPEVSVHERTPADAFIVLGSDGVWDFLDNDEAAAVVQAAVSRGDAKGAAQALVEAVVQRAAEECGLETRQALEALPAGRERRRRYDDTTVVVVFLGGQL